MTELEFNEYIKYKNITNLRQICLLRLYSKLGGITSPLVSPANVLTKISEVQKETKKHWQDITGHYNNGVLYIYDKDKTYTTFIRLDYIPKISIAEGAEYWESKIITTHEWD